MITGTCHCGQIGYRYDHTPDYALRCNCSICRRAGLLMIYAHPDKIELIGKPADFSTYTRGKKILTFKRCTNCGIFSHWERIDRPKPDLMGVNLNLADPDVVASIPVRYFDGADTWKFLD